MFTGIVEQTVHILRAEDRGASRQLILPRTWTDVKLGDSIAVSGACLTVAGLADRELSFDVIKETLDRTNLGKLRAGDDVNVERALRVGDRIDGHFVQGHVDGLGKLVTKIAHRNEWRLTIEAPSSVAKFLAPKGSICVDGASLTIASVERQQFDVALIPTTLAITNIGRREVGWMFNLEADILAKQVVHYLESRDIRPQKSN
jgi:riboflavin synthase